MRAWTRLRTTGAYWFLPSLFGLGVWEVLINYGGVTGYAAGDYASSAILLPLVGSLTAIQVAWRVPPFIAVLSNSRPIRGRTRVALRWWSSVWIGAPLSAVLAVVCTTRELPQDGASVLVLGIVGIAVLASVAVGFLLGRALPAVVAIPAAAVLPFYWFAFPASREEILPRNLYSGFVGCCTQSDRPATAMVLGSGILDLVVVAGAVLSLVGAATYARHRVTAFGLLVGTLVTAAVLGTVAAIAVPGPLEFSPADPRTTTMRCASRAEHQVCVWPEDEAGLSTALRALVQFDSGVRRAGLPGVRASTERMSPGAAVVISVTLGRSFRDAEDELASAYVAAAATCNGTRQRQWPSVPIAVVSLLIGETEAELTQRGYFYPREISAAQAVLRGSPASVVSWFRQHTCPDRPR